jgi:FKBP-type peptidyl-prolyl cis-trans isomerase FkpA
MTIKLSLLAAVLAVAGLSACGGENSSLSPGPADDRVWVPNVYVGPTVLTKTDLVLGSGAEAVAGKSVTVMLTRWNYSATAADFKGEPYGSVRPEPAYTFTLAISSAPGLADAVLGMKAGGKRGAVIPGDMSPGDWVSARASGVPRLAPSVTEIELISVN